MKRKMGLFLIFGAVVPLAVVSAAWACGVLATLKLNTRTAAPNQVVAATGNNYYGSAPVSIHLNTRNGPVVATTSPDPSSRISTPLTIPANTRPGYHVLIAIEYKPDGTTLVVGTPGRTTVRVVASGKAARRAAVAASPWGSPTPKGPVGSMAPAAHAGGSSSPAVMPMLLALALSLSLLASGMTLSGRRNRTRTAPQFGV